MATSKSTGKPKLAAVPKRDWRDALQDDIQDRNPLIGFGADETMQICSNVLAFLADFHLRTSDSELNDDVDAGEYHVIRVVEDALSRQAAVTTQRVPPKGAANG